MKLLFLIPSMEPPKLEGDFSDEFKDFVAKCLVKEPSDVSRIFRDVDADVMLMTKLSLLPQRWDTAELLEHPFIRKAGRVQSLQRLVNRLAEHKRLTGQHSRSETSISAQTMNMTIDGDEDGWDFGNGTFMSAQGGTTEQDPTVAGTIRPGKGSEARVFERDVQPYQMQPSLSDAYPEDDAARRRTFIVNDDVPDGFEEVGQGCQRCYTGVRVDADALFDRASRPLPPPNHREALRRQILPRSGLPRWTRLRPARSR